MNDYPKYDGISMGGAGSAPGPSFDEPEPEKFQPTAYLVEAGPTDAVAMSAYLNKKRSEGFRLIATTGSPNGHVFIFEATVK